jgi:hypothetical protein
MILRHFPFGFALAWRASSSIARRPLLLRIHAALELTFLLALLKWPVKTAVLLGFIATLGSTAVATAGESEMQPTRSSAFVFQSAIR